MLKVNYGVGVGVGGVEGVVGVGLGAGVGVGIGGMMTGAFAASSSFFCNLAFTAKITTKMTNPPQRIPIIHTITVSTVLHPHELFVSVLGVGVLFPSFDAQLVHSIL